MRALITGIAGFVGTHLGAAAARAGAEVHGIARSGSPSSQVHIGSLLDAAFMDDVLRTVRPTHIFHLAAQLKDDPADVATIYTANVTATARLLASVAASRLDPIVVVASSSAVYGRAAILPITEDAPMAPVNDYGASKAAQEMVALAACASRRLRVVRARVFNLVGPGQSDRFVTATIARQIAEAETRGGGLIRLGNVSARRDFTDVRDAARAYLLLAQHGTPGDVYNVSSGKSKSVSEALDIMVGEALCPIDVFTEPGLGSTAEIDEQIGSYGRLARLTGWHPSITFEQSLRDLLSDWRSRTMRECSKK